MIYLLNKKEFKSHSLHFICGHIRKIVFNLTNCVLKILIAPLNWLKKSFNIFIAFTVPPCIINSPNFRVSIKASIKSSSINTI